MSCLRVRVRGLQRWDGKEEEHREGFWMKEDMKMVW